MTGNDVPEPIRYIRNKPVIYKLAPYAGIVARGRDNFTM